MVKITQEELEEARRKYARRNYDSRRRRSFRLKLEKAGRFATPPYERLTQKAKARYLFHQALSRGTVARKPCLICGDPNSEAHHPDYWKPLEVVWLCKYHHCETHLYQCRATGENGSVFENYLRKHPKSPLTEVNYNSADK